MLIGYAPLTSPVSISAIGTSVVVRPHTALILRFVSVGFHITQSLFESCTALAALTPAVVHVTFLPCSLLAL